MEPISHKNRMFGGTLQKFSSKDLHNTITTLSLLSKDCQQALKELTCLLKRPVGQGKIPLVRNRKSEALSDCYKIDQEGKWQCGEKEKNMKIVETLK